MPTITTGMTIRRISSLDSYPVMWPPSENRLNIARATVSHRIDPVIKRSLTSVGVSSDHIRISVVAQKITCKKWIFVVLLKTKSFLQFQTAHNKAHTPTRICLAISGSIPSSHVPNNVLIVFGGLILNIMWTIRHNFLAKGQSRKRCLMDLSWSQKLHLVDPVQLRFAKLSLAKWPVYTQTT